MAKKDKDEHWINDIIETDMLNHRDAFLPTGIIPFDAFMAGEKRINDSMLNNIGIPLRKRISFSGKNGIGKSTFMYEISKRNCQLDDIIGEKSKVLYLDVEKGINAKSLYDYNLMKFAAYNSDVEKCEDPEQLKKIRIECLKSFLNGESRFYAISPQTYTQTMVFLRHIFSENKIGRIVSVIIDSIKEISPSSLYDNDDNVEDQQMMIDAKSQEYFLKSLKNFVSVNDFQCLVLNQARVGKKGMFYCDGEAGGNAFRHGMDIRLWITERKPIVEQVRNNVGELVEKKIGNWINMEILKGRFGNSFTKFTLPVIFGRGVSMVNLYYEIMLAFNIIQKKGSWYSIDIPELNLLEKYQGESKGLKIIKANFRNLEKYIIEKDLICVESKDLTGEKEISEIESISETFGG